jgi:hypothetical protein
MWFEAMPDRVETLNRIGNEPEITAFLGEILH